MQLGIIGAIILVDLALSGDNALVIGAAAAKLPRRQRWPALTLGGGGAIILRILFAILATFLLKLPFLQALGAIILLIIAFQLIVEKAEKQEHKASPSGNASGQGKTGSATRKSAFTSPKEIWRSLLTILLADATMSLDNVLAVGALANGHWVVLIIGLLISIILLFIGSALVSEIMSHLPWLIDLASLILAWTAANMLLEDQRLKPVFAQIPSAHIMLPALILALVLIVDGLLWWRERRKKNARRQNLLTH